MFGETQFASQPFASNGEEIVPTVYSWNVICKKPDEWTIVDASVDRWIGGQAYLLANDGFLIIHPVGHRLEFSSDAKATVWEEVPKNVIPTKQCIH